MQSKSYIPNQPPPQPIAYQLERNNKYPANKHTYIGIYSAETLLLYNPYIPFTKLQIYPGLLSNLIHQPCLIQRPATQSLFTTTQLSLSLIQCHPIILLVLVSYLSMEAPLVACLLEACRNAPVITKFSCFTHGPCESVGEPIKDLSGSC